MLAVKSITLLAVLVCTIREKEKHTHNTNSNYTK